MKRQRLEVDQQCVGANVVRPVACPIDGIRAFVKMCEQTLVEYDVTADLANAIRAHSVGEADRYFKPPALPQSTGKVAE